MVKNLPSSVGYMGSIPGLIGDQPERRNEEPVLLKKKKKKKQKPNPGSPNEGDRDSRRNTPIEKKYQPFPHTEVRGKSG